MLIYTAEGGKLDGVGKIKRLGMGVLITAGHQTSYSRNYYRDVPLALDNGAWSAWKHGYGFNEYEFLRALSEVIKRRLTLNFLVCPDIVAGGLESLDFSLSWKKRLAGWKNVYLAVQDGMDVHYIRTLGVIPINRFGGIFVGGTIIWKYSTAAEWVNLAHSYGLPCHIGRVGTPDKISWAEGIGADSIDSSSFTRNGTHHYIEVGRGQQRIESCYL